MQTIERSEDLLEAYEKLSGNGTVFEFLELVRKTHSLFHENENGHSSLLGLPIIWRVGIQSMNGNETAIGIGESFDPFFNILFFQLLTVDGVEISPLYPGEEIRWDSVIVGSNQ